MARASAKVFLQKAASREYFVGPDKWHVDPGEALDFEDSVRALRFANKHKLAGVHVVVRFSNRRFDLKIPARPR